MNILYLHLYICMAKWFLEFFYFEATGFYSFKLACFTGTSQFQETENVGSGQTGAVHTEKQCCRSRPLSWESGSFNVDPDNVVEDPDNVNSWRSG